MCPGHEQLSPCASTGFQSHRKVCVPFRGVVKVTKNLSHLLLERTPHPQLPLGSGNTERNFCFTGQQQQNELVTVSMKDASLFLENCPGGEGMTREWQKPHFSLSQLWWNLGMQRFWARPAEQFQPNTQPIRINQHMDLRSCHGLAELNWIIHFSQYYHIRAAANPSGAAVCCRLKPWPQSLGYAWLNNIKKVSLQTFNC